MSRSPIPSGTWLKRSRLQENSIISLKGIGPKRGEILKREAGIETIEDLFYYIPRRYIDRSSFKKIKDCFINETVTVSGTIERIALAGKKKRFLEVTISDGSDSLKGIFFGGVNFFKKIFQEGDFVIFSGKISFYRDKQIVHPDFDFVDNDSRLQMINTGRIVPLYRSSEQLKNAGFDSRGFRKIVRSAIDLYLHRVTDPLDEGILSRNGLQPLEQAIKSVHFPDTFKEAETARKRLAFNEIFFLQYYLHVTKRYIRENTRKKVTLRDPVPYKDFMKNLPFRLTDDQVKSIEEIKNDILSPLPMNRLLQGDVGSGKTAVAAAVSLIAAGCGHQVAYMAPTEVLAQQQFATIKSMVPDNISVDLLTGSTLKKKRDSLLRETSSGIINILIGTHALIQEDISFRSLGLVVIDEQHRFGVEQRAALRKKGDNPDLLVMTATPIPRSLSLTLYGDMDVSFIRSKPSNRLPVKTLSFPASRIKAVYNSLEKYITMGYQVYYVLPLIEDSEKIDLKSAMEVYGRLSSEVFPHRNVELIHGRLKQEEKERVMESFTRNEIDILVSTTVIEVGIDVPNANVIVIEHAERFGLSQLHQLRGRVGRGEIQSFCVLIYPDDLSEEGKKRIRVIEESDDGFRISEEDLKLRGAGQLMGTKQHGHGAEFQFTDLLNDMDTIESARDEAVKAVKSISDLKSKFEELGNFKSDQFMNWVQEKRIYSILS